LHTIMGLNVTFSPHALENIDVRLFPESRHRSRRIHKKLCKRFGGEFKKVPVMFKGPQGIICHPALKADFLAAIEKANRTWKA
jgi:hypothetical protein